MAFATKTKWLDAKMKQAAITIRLPQILVNASLPMTDMIVTEVA
jgi:hypothetical protein